VCLTTKPAGEFSYDGAVWGLILAASIGSFWLLLPKGDQLHPLATMPVLESAIPIGIVAGAAIGVALISSVIRLLPVKNHTRP
jgi:hypothetical protein